MNGLTTTQILTLARKKILEETSEIVTDETLLIYGNLTQDDLAVRSFIESQVKSASVTITAGVGVLPDDFGTLYGDPQKDVNNIYPEMSIADFTRLTSGQGVTIEEGSLKTYPATSFTLEIKYYPSYAAIAVNTNPTIDPYFHELIVYGMIYRAIEDLQDEELAKYYRQKYEDEFTLKRNARSGYEESNQRGGEMFHGIEIVSDSGQPGSFF